MSYTPFVESQDVLHDPPVLRARLQEFGYLFFRGLLNKKRLIDLRNEFLIICDKHGWTVPGSAPEEGRGRKDAYEGYFEFTDVYKDLQLLESFHALAFDPAILDVLRKAFDDDVFPHARNISRITLPGSAKMTTPSHQDYVFIQGSQAFHTVWIPLVDCPFELGGLIVAPGSQHRGILPTTKAAGTGGLCTDVDDDTLEWHTSEFEVGDFIMFHSLTLHKALSNTTEDRFRLSCDYRYQPRSESEVVWDTLRPHMQLYSWEEIYKNWKEDQFKYYWHKERLSVVPGVHPMEVAPAGNADD